MSTDRRRALDYASRHVDKIAEEVRALQALLALRPGPELVEELGAWVYEHHEAGARAKTRSGTGAHLSMSYGVSVGRWEIDVNIGDGRSHPKADDVGWLRAESADFATAAAEILSYLREVEG